MWLYVWLGVVALSVIVEFVTFDLVSVWFIGGGLVAMILSACKVQLVWQLVAFIGVSIILLITCRKPLLKMLNKNKSATNASSLIGKDTTLLTPISFDNVGSVKVNGVVWTAIAENEMTLIEQGAIVTITAIQGNKLIVKEVNK